MVSRSVRHQSTSLADHHPALLPPTRAPLIFTINRLQVRLRLRSTELINLHTPPHLSTTYQLPLTILGANRVSTMGYLPLMLHMRIPMARLEMTTRFAWGLACLPQTMVFRFSMLRCPRRSIPTAFPTRLASLLRRGRRQCRPNLAWSRRHHL